METGGGRFGASLMRTPEAAARCVEAMLAATGGAVPVSVKCRLGVSEFPEDALLSGIYAFI